MDVDWTTENGDKARKRCCLILHGLEGHSRAPYVKAMAQAFMKASYAVGALNLRGCSGEPNRLKRFYHSGDTEGLAHILESLSDRYEDVYLVGFSLGGNTALKYLGEDVSRVPDAVRGAVALSVPCDLGSAADRLVEKSNAFYMKRFIKLLCAKLAEKEKRYPEYRYESGCRSMRSFHEFDEVYTAPLNGFRSAEDYWSQCSCVRYLEAIDRPTLLINARNDPFLSDACFPERIARDHSYLHLEIPDTGGHCGFPGRKREGAYWHARRALNFLKNC